MFKNTHNSLKLLLVCLAFLCFHNKISAQTNYSQLVNPFVGTGGHGHTFPGPVVPFGMVQVGPDTRVDGSWDGCSGYHHSDSIIYGFSHTHLSGTGCSDFGDVMIMPMAGQPSFDNKKYSSKFNHKNEVAKAGYYSVHLDDDDVNVELTTTTRVGFHKYTFGKNGKYNFILDLLHRDKLLDAQIVIVNEHCIEGFRRSEAWAKDQRVYFRIEFSKDNKTHTLYSGQDKIETGAAFEYDVKKGESIYVKVAISNVDVEGARKNMLAELPAWDFEQTRKEAETLWNKELSKIEVSGGSDEQRRIFYTALYHCFIHPSIANDVDGRYLGRDFKIYKTDGFNYYSVFSLWDTFRALHPLFNLVQRERNIDFIKTFIAQYQQVGRMPMWELGSNETDCMIGYHSVSIIADALAKSNNRFEPKKALEATLGTARNHQYGASTFAKKGFLSVEDEHECVSKNLEYSYNDWCVYQIAKHIDLSKAEELKASLELRNWQQTFNAKTGFMQPRFNGGWYAPFEPKEVNNNYTEANAWQYSFFVPQDVPGLITAMGGNDAFERKLDELFETSSKTSGREQADITGLIGQYAHGNEPSHHMAYLYNFINKPHKTQGRVQQILREMYHNAPDGLAGNEDCGQMSAWYVFSAMGFYPVTPGLNSYELGSGLFNEVKIKVGKQTNVLKFDHIDAKRMYVEESNANLGKRRNSLSELTEYADGYWGNKNTSYKFYVPDSNITQYFYFNTSIVPFKVEGSVQYTANLLPSPIIESAARTFKDSLLVSIYPNFVKKGIKIKYEVTDLDNKKILEEAYTKPFFVHQSCSVHAYVSDVESLGQPLSSHAKFYRIPHNWEVSLATPYNSQYTAGGASGLIDGIYGEKDWRKGAWQGYYGEDLVAVIDLKKEQEISNVFANFLQDQKPWIMMPKEVEFYGSIDGINYSSLGVVTHDIPENYEGVIIQKLELGLSKKTKAKFIKVVAKNYGKLPSWHLSAGQNAYIFVDEIGVR
jgi:predicted alpha-1,2-mannosidase